MENDEFAFSTSSRRYSWSVVDEIRYDAAEKGAKALAYKFTLAQEVCECVVCEIENHNIFDKN